MADGSQLTLVGLILDPFSIILYQDKMYIPLSLKDTTKATEGRGPIAPAYYFS